MAILRVPAGLEPPPPVMTDVITPTPAVLEIRIITRAPMVPVFVALLTVRHGRVAPPGWNVIQDSPLRETGKPFRRQHTMDAVMGEEATGLQRDSPYAALAGS